MVFKYQFDRIDDFPPSQGGDDVAWTVGNEDFNHVWENAHDALRFHRGQGFQLLKAGAAGPVRHLSEIAPFLQKRLDDDTPDTIIRCRSVRDGYVVRFRRHDVVVPKAEQMISVIAALRGQPYVKGFLDCSGLTMKAVEEVTGILLPHHADSQYHDSRVIIIPKAKALRGDLVFINRDGNGEIQHVATLLGSQPGYPTTGPLVWDTEPHDTSSPNGWPRPNLGTGVQIRPMYAPWYCGDVVGFGRIVQINGAP